MMSLFKMAAALFVLAPIQAYAQAVAGSSDLAARSDDPAARLSANLVVLSQNPRDVTALIGAGTSAVAVGDGNAALAFLARAEEISPRNGRIKAALGSALLLLERPGEALKLFSEASALGIPDVDIAADRGLAHDLVGDSRRAQRDYLLAQRFAPNDELTRRLALSFGISGDRSHALALLDPLLRKQDQAAWRARAFILAMTGDLAEAEEIASTVMPSGMGSGMRPFLRRLATLKPADRAMAVNFGAMPDDGTRLAATGGSSTIAGNAARPLMPAADLDPPRVDDHVTRTAAASITRDPRRRPGAADATRATSGLGGGAKSVTASVATGTPPPVATPGRIERRIEKRLAPVAQDRLPDAIRAPVTLASAGSADVMPEVAARSVVVASPPVEAGMVAKPPAIATGVAGGAAELPPVFEVPATPVKTEASLAKAPDLSPGPASVVIAQAAAAAPNGPAVSTPVQTASVVGLAPPAPTEAPAVIENSPASASAGPGQAAVATFASPPPPPVTTAAPPPAVVAAAPAGLADIIAAIEPEPESVAAPLPSAAELRAARIAQQKKLALQAKADADAKAEKEAKDAAKREAARHPARVWVQVATGANEAGLPSTWAKIRDKTPQLFKGLSAASVPFRATNRLLVGPFKTQAEARALVNGMQKQGLAGSTFASEAGQMVARIAGK